MRALGRRVEQGARRMEAEEKEREEEERKRRREQRERERRGERALSGDGEVQGEGEGDGAGVGGGQRREQLVRALAALFDATGGREGQWEQSDGWEEGVREQRSLERWTGLKVEHGPDGAPVVREIKLPRNGLQGSVPVEAFSGVGDTLGASLQVLNLRRNEALGGELPPLQLFQLLTLDVSHTHLTALPGDMRALGRLQELYCSNAALVELPEALGDLRELKVLDVHENQIRSLPDRLPRKVERLLLANNEISVLPESISRCGGLQILRCEHNALEQLPDGIGELSELEELYVAGNALQGLPESIGSLNNLVVLVANDNPFAALPESFTQLNLTLVSLPRACQSTTRLSRAISHRRFWTGIQKTNFK